MFSSPGQIASPSMQEKLTCGDEVASAYREPPALSHRMQLTSVGEECPEQYTPPPVLAAFPAIVQFVSVGEESPRQSTPPGEFCVIVQSVSVGEESWQDTPPPEYRAEFPVIVQSANVGEDALQYTPPPSFSASSLYRPPMRSDRPRPRSTALTLAWRAWR